MTTLPKPRTKADAAKEMAETKDTWQATLHLLSTMYGPDSKLPETDDLYEVEQKAAHDFGNSDFSDAWTYLNTAIKVAEFYQSLAESYLEALNDNGIRVDENGYVVAEPVVIQEGGKVVYGFAEVIDWEETEDYRQDLWEDYIKPTLKYAPKQQQEWAAKKFGPEPV